MASKFCSLVRAAGLALSLTSLPHLAAAEPSHAIAMYGEPALPPDFVSLPYVNPDAPTGGRIVTGEVSSFDSLNPYIRRGTVPWQLRFLAVESLMGRSWDEPFTLYGLLAETIETGPNREWVEFTLREEARFSDGSPVTVEDVMWSYETLGTEGHPRYLNFWTKVESMEQTGERSVRFTFNEENRELALITGLRPILKKAQWDETDFTRSGVDVIPITTAPYVVDEVVPGRVLSLKRDPGYWGNDLPFRRGTHNLDEIRIEFFGDGTAQFEAFKAGILNSNREFNVAKWDSQYDFPAIDSGDVIKSVIPHQRPSGMTGYVMNTRKAPFDDWRVRDAMIVAFNYEFINETITGGEQPRITSYFSNSILGMEHGPAEGRVAEFLDPFADQLLPGTLEGYSLPVSDGSERNRAGTRAALTRLEEAGWTIQDGALKNEAGEPFAFEILFRQGDMENTSIIDIYVEALQRLGMDVTVSMIDPAQYTERTAAFEYDMTFYRRDLSLSPGNEQYLYFGSEEADTPGGRNSAGVKDPVVDALIDRLLNSESQEDFRASAKALDRVLMAGRYVIPIYQYNVSRIAHAKELKYPEALPIYGDSTSWQPDVWWYEED